MDGAVCDEGEKWRSEEGRNGMTRRNKKKKEKSYASHSFSVLAYVFPFPFPSFPFQLSLPFFLNLDSSVGWEGKPTMDSDNNRSGNAISMETMETGDMAMALRQRSLLFWLHASTNSCPAKILIPDRYAFPYCSGIVHVSVSTTF